MKKSIFMISLLIFASALTFMKREQLIDIKVSKVAQSYSSLGYSEEDLDYLKLLLNESDMNKILSKRIPRNTLFSYVMYKGFHIDGINKYETIRKTKRIKPLEALNRVNHPYMMKAFYEHQFEALNPNTNLILVNKNYYLSKDYKPRELVYCETINLILPDDRVRNLLEKEAYLAVKELFQSAKRQGLDLFLSNAYRTYNRQEFIYNQYILEGEDADRYSARPGHSEHQTGLALDVTSRSVDFLLVPRFEDTIEGQFLKHNAHKYGFIIRYLKDKEHITGYTYEPWHLRYVGIEEATYMYQHHLTLEEYLIKMTELPK